MKAEPDDREWRVLVERGPAARTRWPASPSRAFGKQTRQRLGVRRYRVPVRSRDSVRVLPNVRSVRHL